MQFSPSLHGIILDIPDKQFLASTVLNGMLPSNAKSLDISIFARNSFEDGKLEIF